MRSGAVRPSIIFVCTALVTTLTPRAKSSVKSSSPRSAVIERPKAAPYATKSRASSVRWNGKSFARALRPGKTLLRRAALLEDSRLGARVVATLEPVGPIRMGVGWPIVVNLGADSVEVVAGAFGHELIERVQARL